MCIFMYIYTELVRQNGMGKLIVAGLITWYQSHILKREKSLLSILVFEHCRHCLSSTTIFAWAFRHLHLPLPSLLLFGCCPSLCPFGKLKENQWRRWLVACKWIYLFYLLYFVLLPLFYKQLKRGVFNLLWG